MRVDCDALHAPNRLGYPKIMGTKKQNQNELSGAAAVLGRKGGAAKTPAKARAARANGKKGGRPRLKAAIGSVIACIMLAGLSACGASPACEIAVEREVDLPECTGQAPMLGCVADLESPDTKFACAPYGWVRVGNG
jgi:hypothetical protein